MTRRTGPTRRARDEVFARDSSCVVCGETFHLQIHHRRPRGSGGTRRPESNEPANLVLVCLEHHIWIESNRDLARQRGYLVPQRIAPQDVPIVWHGTFVYLCDDGTVHPIGLDALEDLAAVPVSDQRHGGENLGDTA